MFRHHTARRHRTTLPDSHSRQDNNMSTNPAIIANHNGQRILDVVAPALNGCFVRCGEDRHVWAHHDAVAYCYETAVEDGQVEVGVEAGADADVGAVVDVAEKDIKSGYVMRLPV